MPDSSSSSGLDYLANLDRDTHRLADVVATSDLSMSTLVTSASAPARLRALVADATQ